MGASQMGHTFEIKDEFYLDGEKMKKMCIRDRADRKGVSESLPGRGKCVQQAAAQKGGWKG